MSRDGYLPDNVNESDLPGCGPDDDHYAECPCYEDALERCVCGHDLEADHIGGVCFVRDHLKRTFCACVEAEKAEPVCTCRELAEAAESRAADAAESAAEERRMGL